VSSSDHQNDNKDKEKLDAKPIDPLAKKIIEHKELKPKPKPPKFGDDSAEFKAALKKAQSWGLKYKTPDNIPDSEIPESYNYSNLDGFDFTGPIRDQGACGSCYTVSFT